MLLVHGERVGVAGHLLVGGVGHRHHLGHTVGVPGDAGRTREGHGVPARHGQARDVEVGPHPAIFVGRDRHVGGADVDAEPIVIVDGDVDTEVDGVVTRGFGVPARDARRVLVERVERRAPAGVPVVLEGDVEAHRVHHNVALGRRLDEGEVGDVGHRHLHATDHDVGAGEGGGGREAAPAELVALVDGILGEADDVERVVAGGTGVLDLGGVAGLDRGRVGVDRARLVCVLSRVDLARGVFEVVSGGVVGLDLVVELAAGGEGEGGEEQDGAEHGLPRNGEGRGRPVG